MFKNIIIAVLATAIYRMDLVEGIKVWEKEILTFCMFVCVVALVGAVERIVYKNINMLNPRSFERYKKWMAKRLNEKAAAKSEEYRKQLIINIIAYQKKYAFSGKQMRELLELATTEQKEKSA